jgi:peptide/nickel transport system substrate-binding protein
MKKEPAVEEKFGKPHYGGTMNLRVDSDIVTFDPNDKASRYNITSGWLETLHAGYWPLEPVPFDQKFGHLNYTNCHLAESWEFSEPGTYVVHLRKGIHWQDIPPVNGRELTSDDVAYHYHRMYGLGHGFTERGAGAHYQFTPLESVTVIDKYTIAFKWKVNTEEVIRDAMQAWGTLASIEAPEAVEKWGNLDDWHHAIGTGPFILKDFVPGNSVTLVKNPTYWGHDEQNPQNQLPYVDTLKILIIPDKAEAIEALCAGEIDVLDEISYKQAQKIIKTNPELLQVSTPAHTALTIDPRNDAKPFSDIKVRKAMQMAIDLPTIARTHYGGNCRPYPSSTTSYYMKGWGLPYEEWPQDLKDEYAYNPTMAKQLLADAGYPDGFKTNIVADATGDIDLLQIVKTYFAAIGIDMEIRTMDSAAASAFLHARKQDQLAQLGRTGKLGSLGINPVNFVSRLASNPSHYMAISDPVLDAFHPKVWAATNFDEVKKLLRDCNEYVARQHFLISLLQPMEYTFYQPWFKGYSGQLDSISGPSGPHLLFYYPARFWIDQNLKSDLRGRG